MNPFDPRGHSTHEKATHAGSISYIFGKSYVVVCEGFTTPGPDDGGITQITCRNVAGNEIAVLEISASEVVTKLKAMIAKVLSSQLSDVASLQLKLVTLDGELLCNDSSLSDIFGRREE